MELDWKAKRRVATLSPFASSQRGRGIDIDSRSVQHQCPFIACSYPFAKFNSNLAPHPYYRAEKCVCWGPLRVVFDGSVEMFEFVIPKLTDYFPKKLNARMSYPL